MITLFIGTPEIVVILLIVLMLFGAKKIPEVAKGLGKGIRELQKASEEIKREITSAGETIKENPVGDIDKDLQNLTDQLNNPTTTAKKTPEEKNSPEDSARETET